MKRYLTIIMLMASVLTASAQRFTDKIDRGLVAIPAATSGNYITWRRFGEEYYDVTYNLYRDGVKIASNLSKMNYVDTGGNASSKYQVSAVVRGIEQDPCKAVKRWANQYFDIKVKDAIDRNGANVTSHYTLNDVTLADVDGDGVTEFIVKRPCDISTDVSNKAAFHRYDCYKLDGTMLWWIDMGPNMQSGADEQWDIVAYDWDMDGRAEILFRGADNMIIHHGDGSTTRIGSTADTRWNGIEYTNSGNEYLIYADGETAVPWVNMAYPLARGAASDWGDDYGHRSTKHFFGAPFLDGRKASILLVRGIYTKHVMIAYDVDPETHQLTCRWRWDGPSSGSWFGQGFHNYAIADVDWDGRDEIVMGSMVIDDNGKGLSTTGLGHGDAQHCGDLDPYRHGQEQFTCNESSPNMNYRNATTSKIYFRSVGTADDGRALCGNFTNNYPGSVGRSTNTGMVSSVADKVISELGDFIAWSDLNNRIYWDGDLCDEVLNSPGTEREAKVEKPGTGRIFTSSGCKMNNWSKNNPGAQADIFGDWREELVLRTDNNAYLRIYVSNAETKYNIYSLWHDHQYRQAMVWQPLGYNQPPHTSYFLGEMEGITMAPPPLTMTDRTEVKNNETIGTDLNDKHVILCETSDASFSIASGAVPYILTVNTPSWVQGATDNNKIKTEYFTHQLHGSLTGSTRLVKQGDGVLMLSSEAPHTYSGNTDVWAGSIEFNGGEGTIANSNVWMNRFTSIKGNVAFGRNVTMEYASVLYPHNDKVKCVCAGHMSMDTLTMNMGSRIVFTVFAEDGQEPENDCIKANRLVIQKKNWKYGPEFLTPVFEFQLGDNVEDGRFLIMDVHEISGSLDDIVIKGVSGKKSYLEQEGTAIYLVVEGVRDAGSIYWTGTESNIWNFANAVNFVSETGDKDVFVQGDKVTFNDDASTFTVNISNEIPADSIIVDNTKDYTFAGTGEITDNAVLVKKNTGKLTITGDHSYNGGNHILGGTVVVSSLANANQAKGNLGAVTSVATKFTIEDGGTLQTTAAVTCGSPIKLVGEAGGIINNSADFNMNKAFSGTMLTKKGGGWLKLYAANASLQTLSIAAGTVESTVDVPAKTVEMTGGALNFDGNGTTTITIPQGKNATINCYGDRSVYNLTLKGAGNVTVYYPLVKGSGWYATRADMKGNWSAFEGTVKPTGVADDGRFCFNNSYGMPKGTLNIPAGITVENTAKSFKIGQVTGSGNLGGVCSLSSSSPGSTTSWTVGNDQNFSFDGKVTGTNTTFTKVGIGKMSIKGAWNNTGQVKINEGELHVSSGGALGTGMLTVAAGATFSGLTNTTGNLTNSSYTINGTVQVGTIASSTSGIMQFGGKNVTFNSGSTLLVGVNKTSATGNVSKTQIKNIGKLTMNGTIEVYLGSKALQNLQPGDEVQIWEAASFMGTPSFVFPDGVEFDTSRISEGILVVTLVDGIGSIHHDIAYDVMYNLQGAKVGAGYHGIVIKNGKKILMK